MSGRRPVRHATDRSSPLRGDSALGLLRSRAGGVALEFALLLPILVFTLIGLWDFARVVGEDGRLASAALAGVHFGMQSTAHAADAAGIVQAVREDAQDTAGLLDISTARTCSCGDGVVIACTQLCATIGKPIMHVRVQINESFRTMVSYPMVANPIPITRDASMRVQ